MSAPLAMRVLKSCRERTCLAWRAREWLFRGTARPRGPAARSGVALDTSRNQRDSADSVESVCVHSTVSPVVILHRKSTHYTHTSPTIHTHHPRTHRRLAQLVLQEEYVAAIEVGATEVGRHDLGGAVAVAAVVRGLRGMCASELWLRRCDVG